MLQHILLLIGLYIFFNVWKKILSLLAIQNSSLDLACSLPARASEVSRNMVSFIFCWFVCLGKVSTYQFHRLI